jgi:methionyl aminopeptidase
LPVKNIGKTISQTIAGFGLQAVRNLAGHGLGFNKVHMPPQIPNYEDGSTGVIKPGMTFAIEPFATNGKGLIHEVGAATIYSYIGKGRAQSDDAKHLMTKIKSFDGLPFALHDLLHEGLPFGQVKLAVDELLKMKVIYGYPPLVEVEGGFVAQAENSILVDDQGEVLVTTRLN